MMKRIPIFMGGLALLAALPMCTWAEPFPSEAGSSISEPSSSGPAISEPFVSVAPERSYSMFMLVKTTNEWLALSPDMRFEFLETEIDPLLSNYPDLNMRFFDTEGFNSRVTDVIVWETQNLNQYQSMVEQLRETQFWGTYFEVVEILPGIENAYAEEYSVEPF